MYIYMYIYIFNKYVCICTCVYILLHIGDLCFADEGESGMCCAARAVGGAAYQAPFGEVVLDPQFLSAVTVDPVCMAVEQNALGQRVFFSGETLDVEKKIGKNG